VYLVNSRDTKNLPGRKSDVQESQWLMKLHTYGRSGLGDGVKRALIEYATRFPKVETQCKDRASVF
jgi:hypothetical protein